MEPNDDKYISAPGLFVMLCAAICAVAFLMYHAYLVGLNG